MKNVQIGGGKLLLNRRAFTLIELLAVIVILAIIALIAVPIILNIIDDAKKESDERSVELYASAVKNGIAKYQLNGSEVPAGTYNKENILPFKVEYEGNVECETIEIHEDGTIYLGECTVNGGKEIHTYGTPGPKIYANGEVVYFDVAKGVGCTKEEYEGSHAKIEMYKYSEGWDGVDTVWEPYTYEIEDYINSLTGYNGFEYNGIIEYTEEAQEIMKEKQNSCLKFYAFNDDGSDKVNLLLDHSTTEKIQWNSGGSNNGPKEVLEELKIDTENWKGTQTPTTYILDQSNATSKAKYTIDYEKLGMKARLITAEEIAQITGNINWDVTSDSINWYYFDSLTTTRSDTCKEGNISGCKYGWLYDRTQNSCTKYGCLNNSLGDPGDIYYYYSELYWTASSQASKAGLVWVVERDGCISLGTDRIKTSVRPVIEVLKSKLN